jgi:transketolase
VRRLAGRLPSTLEAALPKWTPSDKPLATRQASQAVINAIAPVLPELVYHLSNLIYAPCYSMLVLIAWYGMVSRLVVVPT